MIDSLVWKPDFAKTAARFEAWWRRELIDRPPVSLSIAPSRPPESPARSHASLRQRWMDVEYVVDSAIAQMQSTEYAGDSFPIFNPNLGPEITATLFGCELSFSESTSWTSPVVHSPDDWATVLDRQPDFDNVYWRTIELMTDYAIQRSEGRFLVGITDLHGGYDILAGLRDPQDLCMDVIDCPDLLKQVGRHVSSGYVQAFERSYAKVAAAGFGSTCWCPLYHAGPAYVPSCDFWCMVSNDFARDVILPDILIEMAPLKRNIFHLDGPQALRHLDLLLDLPKLDAVQWVFGSGNGPASKWIDVYRRIAATGKSVQILAESAADALTVLDALGPKGLWLYVSESFQTRPQALAFLAAVEQRSRGRTLVQGIATTGTKG